MVLLSITPPQQVLLPKKSPYRSLPSKLCKKRKYCNDPISSPLLYSRRLFFPDKFCKSFISDVQEQTLLGKGSFGQVILGKINNSNVAAKICPISQCGCNGEKNAMLVKHPNVITIYRIYEIPPSQVDTTVLAYLMGIGMQTDLFRKFGVQILVMEYAGRHSLQQLLDSDEEMSVERRCSMLPQIAAAIAHCHACGIIHGDVKPANIMVMSSGERDHCKLVDFGSSRCIEREHKCEHHTNKRHTLSGTTIVYSAPEVFIGMNLTPKVDVYSFAITMWQLITRETPFANCEAHSIIYRVVSGKLRPSLSSIEVGNSLDSRVYLSLLKECWDQDHTKRPTSEQVCQRLP